jgi:hypothetical protein
MSRSRACSLFHRAAPIFAGVTLSLLSVALTTAGVFHVDGTAASASPDGLTWATAFPTVQAGIDAASAGDEVWVAAATYVGKVQLKAGVALYGGFAGNETQLDQRDWTSHPTILDGNRARGVVGVGAGATNTTRIDGFIIQNGGAGTTVGDSGGIVCISASPVIANNVIRTNRAKLGGGVYCDRSFAIISSNSIVGNIASEGGGGLYFTRSGLWVEGNTITGNRATNQTSVVWGGGVYCSITPSNWTICLTNNTITSNACSAGGGGIECSGGSRVVITRSRISSNSAGPAGGGVEISSASVTLEGNLIEGNSVHDTTVGWGGGVACLGSGSPHILVVNNAILGNAAAKEGGGIYNSASATVIQNNTILGNTAPVGGGIQDTVGGTILNNLIAFGDSGVTLTRNSPIGHNCVFGNTNFNYAGVADPTGTNGNISVDPRLLAAGEYHLATNSPCIDAGDDMLIDPEWLDLDGEPRLMGAHVDIGADEGVSPGVWQRAPVPSDLIQITTTNVGGITYGSYDVGLPDTCYRLLSVGPLAPNGTNFSRDFHILNQTGVACADVATHVRSSFLLGRLAPGSYSLTALAWGQPANTTAFVVNADSAPTLVSMKAPVAGLAAFTTLGVADVRYAVEASPDLTNWSGLVTNLGAPFEFADPGTTNWPQRFYRVSVGP